jgi:hypothetical protein
LALEHAEHGVLSGRNHLANAMAQRVGFVPGLELAQFLADRLHFRAGQSVLTGCHVGFKNGGNAIVDLATDTGKLSGIDKRVGQVVRALKIGSHLLTVQRLGKRLLHFAHSLLHGVLANLAVNRCANSAQFGNVRKRSQRLIECARVELGVAFAAPCVNHVANQRQARQTVLYALHRRAKASGLPKLLTNGRDRANVLHSAHRRVGDAARHTRNSAADLRPDIAASKAKARANASTNGTICQTCTAAGCVVVSRTSAITRAERRISAKGASRADHAARTKTRLKPERGCDAARDAAHGGINGIVRSNLVHAKTCALGIAAGHPNDVVESAH